MILLDTSFLYAVNDGSDRNHSQSVAFLTKLQEQLFLPVPVLSEICYLLHSRLGHHAMRRFLRGLSESEIELLSLTYGDIRIATALLDKFADSGLDFADATIVVLAERTQITKIATFDRRDFSIIRPRHTTVFELLP